MNMPIRSVLSDYLLKKRNPAPPPATVAPFDVSVSNSTAAARGAAPTLPPQDPPFRLTMDDITRPTLTEQMTALPAPVPAEPPVVPVEAAPPAPAPEPLKEPETPPAAPVPADPAPSPEDEAKRKRNERINSIGSTIAQALAGYADAQNAGLGQPSKFLQTIKESGRQSELDAREKTKFEREQAAEAAKDDPNSPHAESLRAVAKKVFPKGDFSKMTPRQLEAALGPYLKLFDIESDEKNRQATLEAARLGRETARDERLGKADEDRIRAFRNDVQGSRSYQDWQQVKGATDLLKQTAENPSAMGSLAAVYSFVKVLDPNSVVREGEIKLMGGARGVGRMIEGALNKMANGQVLTPGELKEVYAWAQQKEAINRQMAIKASESTRAQAERLNLNPAEINSDLWGQPAGKGGPAAPPPLAPNEVMRVAKDGRKIVYDKITKQPLREVK